MSEINLSIIIPAYNESNRIGFTLSRIEEYFKDKNTSYEVIVVDDGSTDETVDTVNSYMDRLSVLKILKNNINKGKGYSVNRGMRIAEGNQRLYMDADNSVDISHVDLFMDTLQNGYDIVIGSIRVGDSYAKERNGIHRRILGKISHALVKMITISHVKDTQRGFKLFSAHAAHIIFPRQTINRFGFDIELLVIACMNKLEVKELPVTWDNPAGSKVTAFSYFQTFRELMLIGRNRVLRRYTVKA